MTKAEIVSANITEREWYRALVEECKAIVTEAVFTSRWALVEGYHALGERIVTEKNLDRKEAYGEKIVTDLSQSTGIHKRDLWRAIQFYKKFPDLSALPGGKNMTWNKVIALLPAPRPAKETPLPVGQFRVIYADPPWQFDNSGLEQSAESHYPTLATEDICKVAIPAASRSVLFMWATNAMLPDALRVVDAWGFEYKTNLVWVKERGPSIGWFVTSRHELLLLAVRGERMHPAIKPSSVIKGEVTIHSKKPPSVYATIESMYKGPYLEMFARNKREGWESWGNEV